jgi:uncharacterized phiE125 gp8 family phage protein
MTALVQFAAPAVEPLSIAEVMAHCRLDASNQEPAPGALTCALASPAVAGSVTAGAHRYRVTFGTADGETEAGAISSAVTVADAAVNGKVALSDIPLGGALVTARKLWRTKAGGDIYYLLATLADNTATTYTDNIADAALGAGAPSTNSTSDPLLSGLIKAARVSAETLTRRALITQTWDLYLDQFPCGAIHIPKPTLQSVSAITYLDNDGVEQTLAADQYLVDAKAEPGRILPAYGLTWPVARRQANAIKVRFVAGYGAAAAVPDGIKQWMKLRISHHVDFRAPVNVGSSVAEFPRSFIDGLLDDYAVPSFNWEPD